MSEIREERGESDGEPGAVVTDWSSPPDEDQKGGKKIWREENALEIEKKK